MRDRSRMSAVRWRRGAEEQGEGDDCDTGSTIDGRRKQVWAAAGMESGRRVADCRRGGNLVSHNSILERERERAVGLLGGEGGIWEMKRVGEWEGR
ncbi:unnamed protein product [Linum trigynum]|uniref:Uncharacterized protein n=1 Tax=Linum trigynum TaxID=586398 RepID=A0AAV2GCZ3_9ROSI